MKLLTFALLLFCSCVRHKVEDDAIDEALRYRQPPPTAVELVERQRQAAVLAKMRAQAPRTDTMVPMPADPAHMLAVLARGNLSGVVQAAQIDQGATLETGLPQLVAKSAKNAKKQPSTVLVPYELIHFDEAVSAATVANFAARRHLRFAKDTEFLAYLSEHTDPAEYQAHPALVTLGVKRKTLDGHRKVTGVWYLKQTLLPSEAGEAPRLHRGLRVQNEGSDFSPSCWFLVVKP